MTDRSARFLSGDWGTSRLRLRLIEWDSLDTIAEVESDDGIGPTFRAWQEAGEPSDREGFYLRRLVPSVDQLREHSGDDLSGLVLVLSGMASATIGMRELPYARAPFPLSAETLPTARIAPGVLPCEVLLVSGVRTENDMMRGEETILLGLAADGLADGLVVLPGTHSKHVILKDRMLERISTFLTGELFALLRDHSVLRASLTPSPKPGDAFEQGVRDSCGANLLHEFFALRAGSVLRGTPPEENAGRLSGLLIGSELRALNELATADLPIIVAAPEPLCSSYQTALRTLGFEHRLKSLTPDLITRLVPLGQRLILKRR